MTTSNVKPMTAVTFKTTLKSWTTGQEKQRDVLQALIVFGLEQFKSSGNTGFLTEAINGVIRVKSIPTNNIKEYIKAHANVVLHQVKEPKVGQLPWVFKKQGKDVVVTMPTVVWYEHTSNKSNKPKADIDGLALLRNALVKALNASKEGKLKAGQAQTIQEVSNAIKAMLDPSYKPALATDSGEVKPNALQA